MANEMAVTIKVAYAKGDDSYSRSVVSSVHDVAEVPRQGGTMSVTSSAANIPKGNVGAPGFVFFKNLGTTYDEQPDAVAILIGHDSSGFKDLLSLGPGVEQWVYLSQDVPQAKTNAGDAELEYMIFSAS